MVHGGNGYPLGHDGYSHSALTVAQHRTSRRTTARKRGDGTSEDRASGSEMLT